MTAAERVLYHQVHPLKLAADIGSTLVAIPLLWSGDGSAGLAIALLVPIAASAAVLRMADLRSIASGPIGGYLRRDMTPPVQAVRLACGLFVLAGAWWHLPVVIVAAVAAILLAWTYGLIAPLLAPQPARRADQARARRKLSPEESRADLVAPASRRSATKQEQNRRRSV